jgi:hypothetical protein
MTPGRQSQGQALSSETPESDLLSKVEFFRKELGSIVPFELNNTKYRTLANCLALAARDLEATLHGSEKSSAALSAFEARQHEKLVERTQGQFGKLCAIRDEMTSLIESHMAELNAPGRGGHRNSD